LYTGFFAIVVVYLWMMMERKMNKFTKPAGIAAFIWRLILTTGTGSIFGFLVARQAYDAAIMAPMFIIMSFSFGLAIFIMVLMATYNGTERELGDKTVNTLKNLLGVFVSAVLYFTLVYHLTNLYATQHHGVERFILMDGGVYTQLFWWGQVLIGGILPLFILYHPSLGKSRQMIAAACAMVVIGGLAQMYVIIIGGQAYPMSLFPGYEVTSSFYDGVIMNYAPSIWEIGLGIAGIAVSMLMVMVAIKVLPFAATSLEDDVVDPHHTKAVDSETVEAEATA
jgi:molybdopterin-containing oxidoreductase family membrane subunit